MSKWRESGVDSICVGQRHLPANLIRQRAYRKAGRNDAD